MSAKRWISSCVRLGGNLLTPQGATQRVSTARYVGGTVSPPQEKVQKEHVQVTFVTSDGQKYTVQGLEGDSLLDVVINKHIPVDGYGACEGTMACSTCHVILSQTDFDKLPSKPTDEELDMLDLAYGLTETSRLGCQVILAKDLNGLVVKMPAGVADARS